MSERSYHGATSRSLGPMGYVSTLSGESESVLVGRLEGVDVVKTRRSIISYMCSIGNTPGEHAGHGNGLTLLASIFPASAPRLV